MSRKNTSRRTSTRPSPGMTVGTPPKAENQAPSLVVGLTGPNASGKGEVAKFLAAGGFAVHSLSDTVREEATRRGLDHSRDNLISVGVDLRARHGPGALAPKVLTRLNGRTVVDSIRNPGDVTVLRALPLFVLVGVDAPQALRCERSIRRGRLGDGATLEEFARKEERENSTTEAGQQILATLALADLVIDNDGSLEDLHRKVRRALRDR